MNWQATASVIIFIRHITAKDNIYIQQSIKGTPTTQQWKNELPT